MTALDTLVERLGRWTAGRSTRRSFFGRAGRVAMLVASGPAIASLLADQAQARVCGQSGVSPKCDNFDCGDVWGWCWYARGCCADGGLKKICDCCAVDWPNVHGYCPSGTNVRCIVESCLNDPRVQVVDLTPVRTEDLLLVAEATHAHRWPSTVESAVIADGSPPWSAVAAPVAAVMGAPAFSVARGPLPDAVRAQLRRLGVRRVAVVGGWLPSQIDDALTADGLAVDRVGSAVDLGPFSEEVATWIRATSGVDRVVHLEASGVSGAAAPVAAAFAAAHGWPVVIGTAAVQAVGVPAMSIGPEAVARRHLLGPLAADATGGQSVPAISVELYDRGTATGRFAPGTFALVPEPSGAAVALGSLRIPVMVHGPSTLHPLQDWLFSREDRFGRADRVFLVGAAGHLDGESYRLLQSILNGFDIHRLIGVAGQGLPVIPQPVDERPIGEARVAAVDGQGSEWDRAAAEPTYWTARADS